MITLQIGNVGSFVGFGLVLGFYYWGFVGGWGLGGSEICWSCHSLDSSLWLVSVLSW